MTATRFTRPGDDGDLCIETGCPNPVVVYIEHRPGKEYGYCRPHADESDAYDRAHPEQ